MQTVGVIVPVYNVEDYLRRCVDSILGQTYRDLQIVLVDDGSTDRCGEICDEYARRDARVVVIHQKNAGLSAARNAGLDSLFQQNKTQYVCFVDSDDWIDIRFVEESLKGISLGVDIACAKCIRVSGPSDVGTLPAQWRCLKTTDYWENEEFAPSAWGKLFLAGLLKDVRFPVGRIYEDQFTTHKVLFSATKIAMSDSPLYCYFQRPGSIINSPWTFHQLDILLGLSEQVDFFTAHGLVEEAERSRRALDRGIGNAILMLRHEAVKTGRRFLFPIGKNRNINFVRHPIAMLFIWPFVRTADILRQGGIVMLWKKVLARVMSK